MLKSMGLQRVRHDGATEYQTITALLCAVPVVKAPQQAG